MRVYIAAPWPLKKDAAQLRAQLAVVGIDSTARWIDINHAGSAQEAENDLNDVFMAQAFVLINPPEFTNKGTGGRHVETGYAIAINRPVFVLGAASNVFHHLARVTIVSDVESLVKELGQVIQL